MRQPHAYCLILFAVLAGAAIAQQDPFEVAPKAADAARPAAKAAKAPAEAQPLPLALEMVRATNPRTAADLLGAAQAALRFGRPDEAKTYLAKLLAEQPADEALAALTTRFGDFLLALDRTKDLQPEGQQAANMILDAAERFVRDPAQIEMLIKQLSDPRPGMQQDALGKLSRAGTTVANPLLQVLADSARASEHANIRSVLARLGAVTELPLLAAIETSNASLKAQVVSVLARIGSSRSAPFLLRLAVDAQQPGAVQQIAAAGVTRMLGTAPNLYDASKYLEDETRRYLRGDIPYETDIDGGVTFWIWDDAQQQAQPIRMPRADAATLLAGRLAIDLYAVNPTNDAAQQLQLLTTLELAQVQAGLDQPISLEQSAGALAIQAGPHAISRVLAAAMREHRVPAAIAAAHILGGAGDPSVLQGSGEHASPLGEAMTYPDRRVRLAAALSAVKLAPGNAFAGAGWVSETLAWIVSTMGSDVVIIGHPRGEEAQTFVGFMNDLGMQGEATYTGRLLAERAFASPDHPFILITDAIDQPPVEELVQWLRRDYRTARQPIGVMVRSERFESLRHYWDNDPYTIVFPRIHSPEIAAQHVANLKAIAGRNLVGVDERSAQAKSAFAALLALAKNPDAMGQYNLPRHQETFARALDNTQLAEPAIAMLELIGNSRAQTALVEFASQTSRDIARRQAAAAALGKAITKRGLLLTQQQIMQQFDRYNASLSLDRPTQEVLSSILDAIEAPAIARGDIPQRE